MNKYRVYVRRGSESFMYRIALLEEKPATKRYRYLDASKKKDVLVLIDLRELYIGQPGSMGYEIRRKVQRIAKLLNEGWPSARALYHIGVFEAPQRKSRYMSRDTKREYFNDWCDRVIAYLERAKELSHEEIA